MRKRTEVFLKILMFLFLFLFLYASSYFISFIKYSNKEDILYNDVILSNQLLKKEIEDIRRVDINDGKIAKVLIRDFYNFYDEIVLDVGKEDVDIYDAVINEEGLIGIIYKVGKNRSYVKLLSSNYNISVRVGNTYGNLNKGIITMVDKNSSIEIGDMVYTSGLDNVLGNIYIGKVVDVDIDSDNIGKVLKIDYVDNRNLNYVAVRGKL